MYLGTLNMNSDKLYRTLRLNTSSTRSLATA